MDEIWSKNKTVNTVLNILVFLVAINFLHYGQFIIPLICLIQFIDAKFVFRVNNWKVFIILCFFGISFFAFSYKSGLYSLMGMCVPMAYYVGSNVVNITKDKLTKIIYLIAFGMAFHVILNFVYNFYLQGVGVFSAYRHFDIWTHTSVKETITAVNIIPLIGVFFYILIIESNKKIKYLALTNMLIIMVYNISLGRRTPVLMMAVSLFVYLISTLLFEKNNKQYVYLLYKIIAILASVFAIGIIIVSFNIYGIGDAFKDTILYKKFLYSSLDERLVIFVDAIKVAPKYLWGGTKLSSVVGINVHDLWMDTYDYAGIIPFTMLIIYSISCLKTIISILINKGIESELKTLLIPFIVCIVLQLLLEPIMTGSSLFLMVVVILFALMEKYENECKFK